jgi:HPt (histidine-containing phosphotransfer) domain-containing protein
MQPARTPTRTITAAEADADAALDPSVLAELRAFAGTDEPALIERLVTLFLSEADGHLREMGAGADARAVQRVAQAAHQLHGSAGFVGARGLMLICADIERLTRQGSLDGLDASLSRLHLALDTLAPRLRVLARPPADEGPRLAKSA